MRLSTWLWHNFVGGVLGRGGHDLGMDDGTATFSKGWLHLLIDQGRGVQVGTALIDKIDKLASPRARERRSALSHIRNGNIRIIDQGLFFPFLSSPFVSFLLLFRI